MHVIALEKASHYCALEPGKTSKEDFLNFIRGAYPDFVYYSKEDDTVGDVPRRELVVRPGAIVDFAKWDGNHVYVTRTVCGKFDIDTWDGEFSSRWPDFNTVRGYAFKVVKVAPGSAEEAMIDVMDTFERILDRQLSPNESQTLMNSLQTFSAVAGASAVDWDSSSLYC